MSDDTPALDFGAFIDCERWDGRLLGRGRRPSSVMDDDDAPDPYRRTHNGALNDSAVRDVAWRTRRAVRRALYHLSARRRPGALGSDVHNHARPVLTPDLVRQIRAAYAGGEPSAVIAKRLGLKRSTVNNVTQGRTWRDVV
jgi:hypothetical protein